MGYVSKKRKNKEIVLENMIYSQAYILAECFDIYVKECLNCRIDVLECFLMVDNCFIELPIQCYSWDAICLSIGFELITSSEETIIDDYFFNIMR